MYFRKNTGFDPSVTVRSTENYRPSLGAALYHGMKESWETSSLMLGDSLIRNYMSRGRGNIMNPDEWRSSKYYRPGLEYEEGMTDEYAKVLATRYDRTKQNEVVYEKTGALGATAYFGGALLGALPDPINVVPFMGLLKKTRPLRTRMSKNVLGRVGVGAIEGGVGAAALQPLLAADRKSHQERYDMKMAATDILIGIGAGGFLTGVMEGGKLALKKYSTDLETGIQTPIEEPRVSRNLDRFSIEGLTNFFRRGFLQLDNNRPVDIAGIENPGPRTRPLTPELTTVRGVGTLRSDVKDIETRLEFVPYDEVVASHIDEGDRLVENPGYPQRLQPRDRDSAESISQIQEISGKDFDARTLVWIDSTGKSGPMVVAKDNNIDSGNGRFLALMRVLKEGGWKAKEYRDWMKHEAPRLNLDPAIVDADPKTILIRRRITDLDRETRIKFTQRSNTDEVARMQLNEIAISDSSMMDESLLRFLQDKNIRDDVNLEFVNRIFDALPSAERKGLTTKGKVNEEGYQRIERALLAKAFHSPEHPEFLSTMINNTASDVKQIANALKNTARRWVYMKAKMKAGVFINQDPTSHLLEAINEFKNLKSSLRKKASEKFTKEDIKKGMSEKLIGKTKGFRYVLREHVNVLRDQMNLDPTVGTHANTVLFLDFLSVADSQEKIELGLRSFTDELEAYPVDQPSIFDQPTMEAILDRTIGAHRTDLKVDVQRMEVDAQTAESPGGIVRVKSLDELYQKAEEKGEPILHKAYAFTDHKGTTYIPTEKVLKELGYTSNYILAHERNIMKARKLVEEEDEIVQDIMEAVEIGDEEAVKPGTIVYYESVKDVEGVNRAELEIEVVAQEFAQQDLAAGKNFETPTRPPEKIREEIESEQIHAQDEEIDFRAREEEDIIEEIPEQGPSDQELEQLEALADQELNQVQDWNPKKELAEIEELERIGDAMDEESPMMNCILGKL